MIIKITATFAWCFLGARHFSQHSFSTQLILTTTLEVRSCY